MGSLRTLPEPYTVSDPEDLLIQANVGLMQIFAGEINLGIEPQSQKLKIERKQVHNFTNLAFSFEIAEINGDMKTVNFPAHYISELVHTLRSSVFEVPCSLIFHLNDFGMKELTTNIPGRLDSWKQHYETKNLEFPEFLMIVIDPTEMVWYEFNTLFYTVPFGNMLKYFVKIMKKQWTRHLFEQVKFEDFNIDDIITPIENHPFAKFYEKLALKNVESSFVVAKKGIHIFANAKREPRVSRRALRKKAAQAAAATRALKRKLREEEEGEEAGESSHIEQSSEATDAPVHVDIEKKEEKYSDEVQKQKGEIKVEQVEKAVVKIEEAEEQETDVTAAERHMDLEVPEKLEGEPEMMEVDEALETEAPEPVVVAKPPKRRKKPKRLVAPRRKRVRKSPSYDIEEEELLLIESEYNRQIGENSDSDASEELGEYSRSSEDPDEPSTSEPKQEKKPCAKEE